MGLQLLRAGHMQTNYGKKRLLVTPTHLERSELPLPMLVDIGNNLGFRVLPPERLRHRRSTSSGMLHALARTPTFVRDVEFRSAESQQRTQVR